MRVGFVVFGLCLAPKIAEAQAIFNDPQRRAYVVPFARAATDCLSRELLKDAVAVEATKAGRVREALAGPFRRCTTDVSAMIAAHDQAYYPGAGEAFFRGAYLADIPRAVLKRVQPELDRRDQEATQAAAQTARKAAEAVEQQKANDARAATLWAENDRKRADAARAQATRKMIPPEQAVQAHEPEDRGVTSDPAVVSVAGPGERDSAEKSEIKWKGLALLCAAIYCIFKFGVPVVKASMRRKALMEKYGDENTVERIMDCKIWEGMTAEQVRDSWGYPADIGSGYKSGKTTETYKYNQTGKNRFASRVFLENEIVTGWQQK